MDFLENRFDLGPNDHNYKLILTHEEIIQRVKDIAYYINTKYRNEEVVITCIMKGAVYFFVDLTRFLKIRYNCYFIEVSSYHNKQTQSEQIELLSKIQPSKFQGKKVILIDELFDNGSTLHFVKTLINKETGVELKDIFTCTMFKKDKSTQYPIPNKIGYEVPDVWLVGYGLDDKQEKRGWPHLFACPKDKSVPHSLDDKIFEDEAFYEQKKYKILNP